MNVLIWRIKMRQFLAITRQGKQFIQKVDIFFLTKFKNSCREKLYVSGLKGHFISTIFVAIAIIFIFQSFHINL